MSGDLSVLMRDALGLHERGRVAEAEAGYRAVLARAPGHAAALHYLGVLLSQTGRGAAGLPLLERAVAAAPMDIDARFNLANAYDELGRADDAAAQLRACVSLEARFVPGWMRLGALLLGTRQFEAAVDCFARAAAVAPTEFSTHYNLGVAHQAAGSLAPAADAYRAAIALDPRNVDALNNLGLVLLRLGDPGGALVHLQQAVALRPDAGGIGVNLGVALRRAGRADEALAAFTAVLAREPRRIDALQGAGAVLGDRGDYAAAAQYLEPLLAHDPRNLAALVALGVRELGEHRPDRARAYFERALAVDPAAPDALANLGTAVLGESADVAQALSLYRRALELQPENSRARSNLAYVLHYDATMTAAALRAVHDGWERHHAEPLRAEWRPHPNVRDPRRRLRVGYVSPDFRAHSCAYFSKPLIVAHDRNAVEVHCYSNAPRKDAVTARFAAAADGWHDIRAMDDAAAAALIRADAIDILVDLAGHTADNRLLLFARKPAPVAVTWLGYPDTTGLRAIDYRLSDAITDPPGAADALSSETLVRLPDGFLCFRPSEEAPAVAGLPARREGGITFGSFNNLVKVNDAVVALWAAVLAAVPGARLALKDGRLRDATLGAATVERFVRCGIARERIVLLPALATPGEFLALYGGIDIALDPFPYNGATTTCEALWMGVPVVTLAGERHAGRVGASLLAQIGRPGWVAADEPDYVRIAAMLASDLDRLAEERAQLRARLAASPLCDARRFARAVESAYRTMWGAWCSGDQPRD